jgi:hypothetical protein
LRAKAFSALHNRAEQRRLLECWALDYQWGELIGLKAQPLNDIRNYFGEKLALYFAFLEFCTKALIPPSVAGLCIFCLDVFLPPKTTSEQWKVTRGVMFVAFGCFTVMWSVSFTELWRRKTARLAFWWGTYEMKRHETARPEFNGRMRLNPVTNMKEAWHESQRRYFRMRLKMNVTVFVLLFFAISVIGLTFQLKFYLVNERKVWWGGAVAGMVNAFQITTFNYLYKEIGITLTKMENHRTDTQYEWAKVLKAFVFQFLNSYFGLFYIAFLKRYVEGGIYTPSDTAAEALGDFEPMPTNPMTFFPSSVPCNWEWYTQHLYNSGVTWNEETKAYWEEVQRTGRCNGCQMVDGVPDCMSELRLSLAFIWIVRIGTNAYEVVRPFLWLQMMLMIEYCLFQKKVDKSAKRKTKVMAAEKYYEQAEYEQKLKRYSEIESFDDYNEMILNYGYVTLFVVAFPASPLFCYLNNVMELHVDAFKMTFFRRPFPDKAEDIGAWFYFVEVMTTTAIIINGAMVFFTSELLDSYSFSTRFIWFFCTEHLLLIAKRLVEEMIPDMPSRVGQLYKRQELIVDKVFKGLMLVEEKQYQEIAEKAKAEIRENPAVERMARSQKGFEFFGNAEFEEDIHGDFEKGDDGRAAVHPDPQARSRKSSNLDAGRKMPSPTPIPR